jgi:O-acetyl-ADP-ribose deacetylase (regulator of RNase III)
VNRGKQLVQRYALSEEKATEIAKSLQDWAFLGKKHGRTTKDVAQFTQRVFGVKLDQAATAYAKALAGDSKAAEELNKQVATRWGTSPETSKEILSNGFAKDAGKLLRNLK